MPSTSSAHDIISNSKGFVGNLMEWAPVFQLKAENIQLREDAHDLQAQIEELEQWKARALKHMTDMAPKRSKAQKDIQTAMELKKKLRAVEKTLHDRVQLEQEARVLQEKEMKLQQRVDQLEKEKKNLLIDSSHAKRQQQRAEAQLSMLEELFRLHLEKLVNIREHAEIGTVNWNKEAQEAITKHKLVHGSSSQTNNSTIFSPVSKDQSPFPPLPSSCISKDFENGSEYDDLKSQAINDSMMIATLNTVSRRCLNWFDQHLKSRYGTFLEREKTLQKQEEEICLLRAQLDATQKQLAQKAKKDLTQSKRLSEVESLNQEISKKLEALQSTAIQTSNAHTLSGEQIKLLLLEIRQYLRLVRSEIKKKFGYVPSTISQAQVWERILIIMENLEHLFKKTGS